MLAGGVIHSRRIMRVPTSPPWLVQRADELEQIKGVFQAALSGTGATLVIEGPAGIGKTSLLAHARGLASETGVRVLHARASQLEREFAMGVVRQWFEPILRGPDREALLAGAAGLAEASLAGAPDMLGLDPSGVFHGLYWLAANLCERGPLLLMLDDAQWADDASLRVVAFLVGRVSSLPLAVIIGTRPDMPGGAVAALNDVRRNPATSVVVPQPLDVDAVEDLLQAVSSASVEREFAGACQKASGGNPFLLWELVRALQAQHVQFTAAAADEVPGVAPSSVARSVGETLERTGGAGTAAARALATIGDGAELDLTAELAELSAEQARDAVSQLVVAGLLEDALPLRFRHPILASAVRATQTSLERAEAHRRAAELLRARGAEVERIALQLMHTTPASDEAVAGELHAAAARARARGAPATAVTLLERALAELPAGEHRAAVLLELGEGEYSLGRTAQAAEHLEQARRCTDDPAVLGRALIGLFQARAGNFADQRALAPLFAESLPNVLERDRELGLRLWALTLLATQPGSEWEAVAQGTEALTCSTPGEALILGHRALPITNSGATAAEVAEASARAARHADALLEEGATALVMTGMVLGLWWGDELEAAEALVDRAIAVAHRRGALAELAVAHQFRANVRRRAGHLRDAETDARTALAASGGAGWGGAGLGWMVPLLGVLVDQGRIAEAEQELAAAHLQGDVPDAPALTLILLARMRLFAARRDHRRAVSDWEEAHRRTQRHFLRLNASFVPDLLDAAECYQTIGDAEQVRLLLEQATALAEDWGAPGFIGQARHAAARLNPGDDATEKLSEAVQELRRSPARLELARALVSLGQALRRRGRRAESREPLREGYDLARQCGAEGLSETARTELRASGVRLRREALTGVESLTASEARIVEMAADGASNPEIAQALFLTVKTVESHLTHAYRKLDVSTRAELRDALAGKHQGAGSVTSLSR